MEIWKYGNMEIWKYGNMQILRNGNMEIWKYEKGKQGSREIRK